MSAIQQMLFAGRAPITVSGTVYGSGSLAIPAGVTSVSLTGQGGTGLPGSPATSATLPKYSYHPDASKFAAFPSSVSSSPAGLSSLQSQSAFPSLLSMPLPLGAAAVSRRPSSGGSSGWLVQYMFWSPDYSEEWVINYYTTTPYGGASDGTPTTTGEVTTATLNGVTNTWAGGYGGAGAPSSQSLSSTGAGQTLTYNVGSGGYLTYSYTY